MDGPAAVLDGLARTELGRRRSRSSGSWLGECGFEDGAGVVAHGGERGGGAQTGDVGEPDVGLDSGGGAEPDGKAA